MLSAALYHVGFHNLKITEDIVIRHERQRPWISIGTLLVFFSRTQVKLVSRDSRVILTWHSLCASRDGSSRNAGNTRKMRLHTGGRGGGATSWDESGEAVGLGANELK